MFAVNPTGVTARTAPVFLVGSSPTRALFVARLPVLIAGFAAQDKLVRGMSLGAVK